MVAPIETFSILDAIPSIRHGFALRVPGVAVDAEKSEVLLALDAAHRSALAAAGLGAHRLVTSEQVHGARVAVVDHRSEPARGADALVTNDPGACLGVYVADCCPVFFVDPEHRCVGLAHSGRKGTELGIAQATVEAMVREFGAEPSGMTAVLGPCIRPPWYEIDFAAEIVRQCEAAQVGFVYDCGLTTACNLDRYYSYRIEKGKTGRMLAMLGLRG